MSSEFSLYHRPLPPRTPILPHQEARALAARRCGNRNRNASSVMPNFFAKNLAAWAGSAASLGIGASGIQLFFALVRLALELNGLLYSLLGLPAGADHSPRALSA